VLILVEAIEFFFEFIFFNKKYITKSIV